MASGGGVWAKPAIWPGHPGKSVFFSKAEIESGRLLRGGLSAAGDKAARSMDLSGMPSNMSKTEAIEWSRRALRAEWLDEGGLRLAKEQARAALEGKRPQDILPRDLTKMTPKQERATVAQLAKLSLRELRRRQGLASAQLRNAVARKDDLAVGNLQVMQGNLTAAVMRREFGE